jgi:hypothetical protein
MKKSGFPDWHGASLYVDWQISFAFNLGAR